MIGDSIGPSVRNIQEAFSGVSGVNNANRFVNVRPPDARNHLTSPLPLRNPTSLFSAL